MISVLNESPMEATVGVLEKKLTRVKVSSGHDGLTSSLQLLLPAQDQARLHSSTQVGNS